MTAHTGPTQVGIGPWKGEGWKVSPSQVNTWVECPRKWGFRYIEGIIVPPGKGALLGSATHDVLEKHFKREAILSDDPKAYMKDPPRRMAQAMLEHLPAVGKTTLTETAFHFVWRSDAGPAVVYRGFIDLGWKEGVGYFISDHKTSSDPVKYGLSDKGLKTDVQAVTYATFGLAHHAVPVIGLQWTYCNTRGKPKPFPRRNTLHITEAHATFEKKVHAVGLRIVDAIDTVEKAAELQANPTACGNYGGCPHAEYCPRTLDETITAALGPKAESENKNMSGLKALLARAGAAPLKDKDAEAARLASGEPGVQSEPGVNVNSPEAPANTDVARTVSQGVGAVDGSKKEQKSGIAALAAAAAGAQTPEEAQEAMDNATPAPAAAPIGAPEGWDHAQTPSQDQILAWVATSTFHDFASTKNGATPDRPFAHGRTLTAMDKNGLIFVQKLDGYRRCLITDVGREKWEVMDKTGLWVGVTPQAAVPAEDTPLPTPATLDVAGALRAAQENSSLVVVGQIHNGKLELTIDLARLGIG